MKRIDIEYSGFVTVEADDIIFVNPAGERIGLDEYQKLSSEQRMIFSIKEITYPRRIALDGEVKAIY